MESVEENILLPEFYDYLQIVLYNGPPNTIYGKYYERVISGNESSILAALKKCAFRSALFRNIINPSDKVILCYLSEFSYLSLKDVKRKQCFSKHLIYKSILINNLNFKDYKSMFNEKEIIELLEQGIDIYRDIDDLTLEMSKLIVSKYLYSYDLLIYIKYWDTELIDMIINHKSIVSNFNIIPNLNKDQIEKAILINPLRLQYFTDIIFDKDLYLNAFNKDINCIEYIPDDFQTDYMCTHTRIKDSQLIRFLRDKTQHDFDRLISRCSGNIKYVPKEFQTFEMCKTCIEDSKSYLEYCYCIDENLLTLIFKSKYNINIPKKDRFNFIIYFNEEALIRILKIRPSLLQILPEDKQTDQLIKEILQSNGYALQHVINPTKEHIKIALLHEPKAIKYVI